MFYSSDYYVKYEVRHLKTPEIQDWRRHPTRDHDDITFHFAAPFSKRNLTTVESPLFNGVLPLKIYITKFFYTKSNKPAFGAFGLTKGERRRR